MAKPTDLHGVPLEVGDAVHSTVLNATGQIYSIEQPGPPVAVCGNPEAKPFERPGKIVILFQVDMMFDNKNLLIQSLKKLAVKAPMDYVQVPQKAKA